MMNVYDHNDAVKVVSGLLSHKNIVPILGSGFTKGEKSKKFTVPDGEKCTELFKGLILQYDSKVILDNNLIQVSEELYRALKRGRIPEKDFIDLLKNYFTGVSLPLLKKEFLSLPWSVGITLNIDDGIEANSDFYGILPYHNARTHNARTHNGKKNLYKLHGDAKYEVDYHEDANLVFNFGQYMQFLQADNNQSMRETLINIYKEQNILFIGCSLQNEPDLRYIYNSLDKNDIANKQNFFLCSNVPSKREQERLEDDYGITGIMQVEEYDKFYTQLIAEMNENNIKQELEAYRFTNPKIQIETRNDYFTGYNIFDRKNNTFHKSDKYILRDLVLEIEKCMESNSIICVYGRHFSGKTALLCSLAEREKQRSVCYFPSDIDVDEDVVHRLIRERENTLFLFDTNSLDRKYYNTLWDLRDSIVNANSVVVLALERDDDFLPYIDNSIFYHLSGRFSENELNNLISLTSSYAFHKRKDKDFNLDYLHRLKKEQGIETSISISLGKQFTRTEQILLLILASKDKVYSKDYSTVLGISNKEIEVFLGKTGSIVEKVKCIKDEARKVSAFKLVHNSKLVLLDIIGKFNRDDILYDICEIVQKFKNGDYRQRSIYKYIMKFDTLNAMFSSSKSAGGLIYDVYESLMGLMADDEHYWLQRSKSMYRLKPNDKNNLLLSYQFAKKAYSDSVGMESSERLNKQTALSVSLICCLLTLQEEDQEKKIKWEDEAIDKGYEAIFSKYFNQEKNMKKALLDNRKNYVDNIMGVCQNVMKRDNVNINVNINLYNKAKAIYEVMKENNGRTFK